MALAPCASVFVNAGIYGDGGDRPFFSGVGDLEGWEHFSRAMDISGDGQIVVGFSRSSKGTEAFSWTNRHINALGMLSDEHAKSSIAHSVSETGLVIVGSAAWKNSTRSVRWAAPGNVEVLPGWPEEFTAGEAHAVSANGQVIVGIARTPDGRRAFKWTDGHVTLLGDQPDAMPLTAEALSADGRVIAGLMQTPDGTRAYVIKDGPPMDLGDLPGGGVNCQPYAVSADGRVIVGSSSSLWGSQAFRSEGERMRGLGSLTATQEIDSLATGVSGDGSIIVGSFSNASGEDEAFIWSTSDGMHSLRDVLVKQCGLDLSGWTLNRAMAVSDDGMTIVGYGRNPDGFGEGWVARLGNRSGNSTASPVSTSHQPLLLKYTWTVDQLLSPTCVAIAENHDLFIADIQARSIVVLGKNGEPIRTMSEAQGIAPSDFAPSAIALTPDESHLIVLDALHDRVIEFDREGNGGRMLNAGSIRLNRPQGLAVTPQHVFVADSGNDRIVRFDPRESNAHTVFGQRGTDPGQFRNPTGIALDPTGHMYVADTDNDRIQKLDATGGVVKVFGQRGRAQRFLMQPTSVAWCGGFVYVADSGNHRIQVFDDDGTWRACIGRKSVLPHEGEGRMYEPRLMAISPGGTLAAVSEPREGRVQMYTPRGSSAQFVLDDQREPPSEDDFGPVMDVSGTLLAVTMPDSGTVQIYTLAQSEPTSIGFVGETGSTATRMIRPAGVAFAANGSQLIVSDSGNRCLRIFSLEAGLAQRASPPLPTEPPIGRLVQSVDCAAIGKTLPAEMRAAVIDPGVIRCDHEGNWYLIDTANRCVLVTDSSFACKRVFGPSDTGPSLHNPVDLAFDAKHRLLVADAGGKQIVVFEREGTLAATWPCKDANGASFQPSGIACDRADRLLVTDSLQGVHVFEPSGTTIAYWGTPGLGRGQLYKPASIGFDAQSRIVVLDWGNHRALLFTTDGEYLGAFGSGLYVRPAIVEPEP